MRRVLLLACLACACSGSHGAGARDARAGGHGDGAPFGELDAGAPDGSSVRDGADAAPAACGSAPGAPVAAPASVTGTQLGLLPSGDTTRGSCGGSGSGEVAYVVDVASPLVALVIAADADVTLYVRRACGDPASELACQAGPRAEVRLGDVAPGRYFVLVDGHGADQRFALTIAGELPADAPCVPGDALAGCGARVCGVREDAARCVVPRCADGADDDGDGKADWPADPGCADGRDDDETDPAMAPACANAADDDGDGRVDWPADPGCTAAGDDDERDQCVAGLEVLDVPPDGVVSGDTSGTRNALMPSCAPNAMQGERAYRFVLAEPALRLEASLVQAFPGASVAVRRERCGDAGAEVACAQANESAVVAPAPAGVYYVIVDGDFQPGPFRLAVRAELAEGAACDPARPALGCGPAHVCDGRCRRSACANGTDDDGDGKVDYPFEPGCASVDGDDERDPTPAPVCGNGLDDDGDGPIDFPADVGCTAASAGSESEPCGFGVDVVDVTATGRASGTTAGAPDRLVPRCDAAATGGERVFAIRVDRRAAALRARLAPGFLGAVLHVRRGDCRVPASEVSCTIGDSLEVSPAEPGVYFVTVDSDFGAGAFSLEVEVLLEDGSPCDAAGGPRRCADGLVCRAGAAGASCGRPACSDGVDNDGDGVVDFPRERGCEGATDDDETDPVVPAVCGNGMDDDRDGLADWPADPGCLGAGSPSEDAPCGPGIVVEDLTATGRAMGSTRGVQNRFGPDPAMGCGVVMGQSGSGNTAGERVYLYRLDAAATLRISTEGAGTDFDTVLYVRRGGCGTVQIGCNDDASGAAGPSSLVLSNQPPGVYFVFVDGYAAAAGNFVLTVGR